MSQTEVLPYRGEVAVPARLTAAAPNRSLQWGRRLVRSAKGLTLIKGKGNGRFGARSTVPGSWRAYNRITSGADSTTAAMA